MSGEWFDWTWDPTLFAGAAEHYDRGRLPYAPGLADALVTALALDGRGRLLDVGCGPGSVTLRLVHVFEEVVGVDADPGMVREAGRIDALRRRHLGDDRRAGATIRNTSPGDEAAVFRGAGFTGPDVVDVPDGRVLARSIDDVVATTFSMSYMAPHLFGDRLGQVEAELRELLDDAAPGGSFGVRLPDNRLNIWRR